jgi:hypothetical protein
MRLSCHTWRHYAHPLTAPVTSAAAFVKVAIVAAW